MILCERSNGRPVGNAPAAITAFPFDNWMNDLTVRIFQFPTES
jgi:hypothetical protein